MSAAPRRLHLLGAGAAGTTLARALLGCGLPLGCVARRSANDAAARVAELGAGEARSLDDVARSGLQEDGPVLALLAVSDDALEPLATRLASCPWPADAVALHLSGARAADVLAPLRARGVAVGAWHPLRSFVAGADVDLRGTAFAVDGDGPALSLAEDLSTRLGGRALPVEGAARLAWHAGASHAANHLVALLDQSLDLLGAAGVARDTGRAALLPLLRDVLAHLEHNDPSEALSGPVARGDARVVAAHLQALQPLDDDLRVAYGALARRALQLARARLSPEDVRELGRILEPPA